MSTITTFITGGTLYLHTTPNLVQDSQQVDQDETISSNDITRYTEIKDNLIKIISEQNPKIALQKLRNLVTTDKFVQKYCHSFTHEVGYESFKKYQSFSTAISHSDDVCGSGYLHGVVSEYFKQVTNPSKIILNLCAAKEWSCKHAIGHGLMYFVKNEIPKALSYCNLFSDSSSRIYCSEGVYMENFETTQSIIQLKYFDPKRPFYPCSTQSGSYKAVCYFYAGRYQVNRAKDNYKQALAYCSEIPEKGYISACVKGVGSVIMRENISNMAVVEPACVNSPDNLQNYCIDGAVGYFVVFYRGTDKAKQEFCPQFTNTSYKSICLSSLRSRGSS